MDDGKFAGVVESVAADALVVRLTTVVAGQAKLRAEKGLNLPDTVLDLPVRGGRRGMGVGQ
jgi:pyruvate kinase